MKEYQDKVVGILNIAYIKGETVKFYGIADKHLFRKLCTTKMCSYIPTFQKFYVGRSCVIWILINLVRRASQVNTGRDTPPPQILKSEVTYKVKLNETICLPCKVKKQYTDHRKCLFYWKKNKTVLLEDRMKYRLKENKCLLIKNIRSSDHARYVCVARSPLGMSQAVRNLIVINRDMDVAYIPQVKESTQNQPSAVPVPVFFYDTLERKAELIRKYFYLGKRAKLKCAISGEPRPKIKWFHNGVSLEGSTWVHIRSRSFALIIDKFTKRHVGNYTCVASNGKGNTSMAFIVSIKLGDPNPPHPTTGERTVSEGDNITLRCKRPAKKVKYLLWDVPKRRSPLQKVRHRGRDPSRISSQPPRSLADNGSIVKLLHLYNISGRKHAGEYRCLALYKRTRKPVPVKIINLKVKSDDKIALPPDNSPNNEILLVKIAVPVMGSVLTLFVVIICFRCRRKTSLNNPAKAKADDDDDALSMQILPTIPTGTLRIHKSLQEFTGSDATRFPDVVSSRSSEKTTTTDCEKTSSSVTSLPRKLFYDNSRKTHTKRLPKSKCTNSNSNPNNINNNSNENIYSPCETEEQLKLQTSTLDNLDNNKKLLYNKNEHKEITNDKLPSCESLHSSCCRLGGNSVRPRTLDSPVLHTEDDLLLQREIKNWEPLIRESKSYRCDKTVNANSKLLRSHSDCSRKVIT